ncbi:molybdopterin molybdotransferase [Symbiobacterium terraclitae]|uniref:Molybdopterin molybdenumtransferase n=1 Tax=Symbiobacterium terraclitae TaxID=557451 RepID=A0ABS4JNI4_9FIRM|nr:gephyrin-like molybdotransferase Glp [Symbiobacterium terraclitae]MBP2017092.1 molybdopterin molybdotransferase [Symbiobacterium terraclitae]
MEFFTLLSVEEARDRWLAAVERRMAAERVAASEAAGRITASPVLSPEELPPFARSSVDGYAVRSADTFGASEGLPAYLTVTAEIPMGQAPTLPLNPGEAQKIATGGALPEGADAVIMVEHTEQSAPDEIAALRPVSPGENVMHRGEDCRAGAELIPAGRLIRAQEAALLSHAGILQVDVVRRPRVAIISTGDELVPADQAPGPGQIRESNGQALSALVLRDGGEPAFLGLAPDDEERILALLRQGMAYDLILISGGSSVGARDLTARLIGRLGEPGVLVHGVKLKPGKPTILAVAGGVPVAGLPGHPVSAQVVYSLFVAPLLRQMQGLPPEPEFRPTVLARLTKNVASTAGRTDVVRVRLFRRDGEVWAEPVHGKSGLISTLVKADGLIVIPSAREGLLAGDTVEVEVLA